MSIKTTHSVTREFALAAIFQKLSQASDIQLENILETVIHNGFYNFQIVENLEGESYILNDLRNLPEYNDTY
jgi:hypothetical protein